MTHLEQVEFDQRLDSAASWIQVVRERLRQNDNTQGPREDLEARVRATEEICVSKEEGRMKVDLVVVAAESLLRTCSEEDRVHIHTKLRELKTLWEETSTYITHCHSRVEWVWLHWGEYLKAYEGLWAWLLRVRMALAPELELQLGLQEKLWQLEHHRVLLEDAQHHASHLERLMEEAEGLHVRTEDESVGPEARKDLESAYNKMLQQAKKRVSSLERIVEEQRAYDNLVEDFRSWLVSQTQKVNQSLDAKGPPEIKLKTLQELYDTVSSREEALCHIEFVAIGVKNGSSPGGAERITQETEALRGVWESLKERLVAEQEALRELQQSQEARVSLSGQLEREVTRLRTLVQKFGRELEDGEEGSLAAWRKSADILSAMATEEPCVEQLKVELKKLFRYPHDATSLSDRVLACMKEFQGVKSRAFRLCAEREAGFTKCLRELLQDHSCWSQMAKKMLEVPLEPPDSKNITLVLGNVEKLLQHRHHLQERQRHLPLDEDSLNIVYGPEKAHDLLKDLDVAFRTREDLYERLQPRKTQLQGMLSNVDQFDKGYESILKHLDSLRERLTSVATLQPDLEAKRTQSDQLKAIVAELEATQADLTSLEALAADNHGYMKRFNLLYAEWKNLLSRAKVKLNENTQNVAEHEEFSRSLLDLEGWLKATQEKMAACGGVSGQGNGDGVSTDIEPGELLEREMQFHQTEAQGQRVMARTGKEGQGQILQALQRLREYWNVIYTLHTQPQSHPRLTERDGKPSATASSRVKSKQMAERVEDTRRGLPSLKQCDSGPRLGYEKEGGNTVRMLATPAMDEYPGGIQELDGQGFRWQHTASGSGGVNQQRLEGVDVSGVLPLVDSSRSTLRHRMNPRGETEGLTSTTTMSLDAQLVSDTAGSVKGSGHAQSGGNPCKHREAFEAWLKRGNAELSKISSYKGPLSPKERQTQQQKLLELRADLTRGHDLFQRMTSAGIEGQALEELRYHWMLYKTKLQDFGNLQTQPELKDKLAPKQTALEARKPQKSGGFLQRVCCVALPLQLLLLSLLLLAFLLPLTEESASCSLVNNFARSFKVMLRHDGLPPT
ncbi:nesprin-3-like isoform X2 [Clupea harengus]|nr:nesprin-3-like isoform X2 [Clupea harengus]